MLPKSGFSLAKILNSTPPERIELSSFVKITAIRVGTSRKSGKVRLVAKTKSEGHAQSDRSHYTTMLEVHGAGRVHLSCSCDDFMYRWEYALSIRDGAQILYGNGEPPVDTNPRLKPGCCKHLVALIYLAKQRQIVR